MRSFVFKFLEVAQSHFWFSNTTYPLTSRHTLFLCPVQEEDGAKNFARTNSYVSPAATFVFWVSMSDSILYFDFVMLHYDFSNGTYLSIKGLPTDVFFAIGLEIAIVQNTPEGISTDYVSDLPSFNFTSHISKSCQFVSHIPENAFLTHHERFSLSICCKLTTLSPYQD